MPHDRSAVVLLALAFSNSLIHALIPSHWLSFALVGRANRWPVRRTLAITAAAGAGHVAITVALGLVVVAAGKQLADRIPAWVEHGAAAATLMLLGAAFLVRASRRSGCQHPGHHHAESDDAQTDANSRGAIGALVMGMTLSPCLDLLSIYVAASSFSWQVVGAVSVVMAVTTVTLMATFVWLTLLGLQRLNFGLLERNEGYIVGAMLIVLGGYILLLR